MCRPMAGFRGNLREVGGGEDRLWVWHRDELVQLFPRLIFKT